jgi:hypothetical protein
MSVRIADICRALALTVSAGKKKGTLWFSINCLISQLTHTLIV